MADKPKSRQEEKSDKKNSEDEGNSEEEDPHATVVPGPGAVGGIQLSDEKDKEVRRKRKMPALKGDEKSGAPGVSTSNELMTTNYFEIKFENKSLAKSVISSLV